MQLIKLKQGNDSYVDRGMQTFNDDPKNKEVQAMKVEQNVSRWLRIYSQIRVCTLRYITVVTLDRAVLFWPWNEIKWTEREPSFWSFDWFCERACYMIGFWSMFIWCHSLIFICRANKILYTAN